MREIRYRQAIYNKAGAFERFHYWGFLRHEELTPGISEFVGPLTGNVSLGKAQGDSEQYTGRQDCKGKDIVEGDKVSIGEPFAERAICAVVFAEGMFGVYVPWHETELTPLNTYCNPVFQGCIEVIGNIHEEG